MRRAVVLLRYSRRHATHDTRHSRNRTATPTHSHEHLKRKIKNYNQCCFYLCSSPRTMAPNHQNIPSSASSSSSNNNNNNTNAMMSGSSTMNSPRPSLREEAAMRATNETTHTHTHTPRHETFPFSQSPQTPSPSSHHHHRHHRHRHPLANSTSETPESLANSARKDWRRHGSGITQELEEKRRIDEERTGTMTVRVLSAETRKDVSGADYTAYIMRVQLINGQVLQLEHRYSECAKLNDILKAHNISMESAALFPSKHWAGRMGNWTPSLKWAPAQHIDLVQFRKIQLDVWLVHVVQKYNLGELPHSVHQAVYDFLTISDRPPCDQPNVSTPDEHWTKWSNPLSFTLGSTIRQATNTLEHMCMCHPSSHGNDNSTKINDQSIPLDLLQSAKGLCFLTVIKAGLVVSGRVGTGLLIARLEDRWSAPVGVQTAGLGWGMLAGADITHFLVVLTTHEAVEALLGGTVQLGAELGVAVGPVGRTGSSHVSASNTDWAVHPAYSYAHSQGFFAGVSLEGSVLTSRHDVNSKFYGQKLTPNQILDLPPPKAAEPLYQVLNKAMATEIPDGAFRPSQLFQDSTTTPIKKTNQHAIHGFPTVDTAGRVTVTGSNNYHRAQQQQQQR